MPKARRRVLVVGGGISGLAFATAACQQGLNVDLVELEPKVVGVGIFLSGSTLRALDSIGLAWQAVQRGFQISSITLFDEGGQQIGDSPLPVIPKATTPTGAAIPRRTLAAILGGAAEAAGAHIRLGLTVDSIEQGLESVEVRLSNGEVASYDLVVGADGIYSRVRELVFGPHLLPFYVGQGGWRFMTERHPAVTSMQMYMKGDVKLGFVPLDDRQMYLLTTLNDAEKRWIDPGRTHEIFRDTLEGMTAPLIVEMRERLVSADPSMVIWRPFEAFFLERAWHQGNVVLIGDAAHSLTPHMASGGGMAIEDAVVLAQWLGRSGPIEPLLNGFYQQRQARVRGIYDLSLSICAEEAKAQPSRDRIYELTSHGYDTLAVPFMHPAVEAGPEAVSA